MKTKLESDYSCYQKLVGFPRQAMNQLDVYKACIIDATNGIRNSEEEQLSPLQRQLLDARRLMYSNQLDAANRLIRKTKREIETPMANQSQEKTLLLGDLSFINGLLLTIKGDFKSAGQKMTEAAVIYEQANDLRRVFKSLINEQICNHNSLSSYESGTLNVFKRSALQSEFHDLAGNILRSQAFELVVEGQIPQAIHFAKQAQEQYLVDGYPDDHMTAIAIEAIGHALTNDFQEAKTTFLKLNTLNNEFKNKSVVYLNVVKDLLFGRMPTPPQFHPLARIPWKRLILKTGSLKSKLIEVLRRGPQTRDNLISQLWGDLAIHPSYVQRLHSLIGEIRDGNLHLIHYDGEFYRLI